MSPKSLVQMQSRSSRPVSQLMRQALPARRVSAACVNRQHRMQQKIMAKAGAAAGGSAGNGFREIPKGTNYTRQLKPDFTVDLPALTGVSRCRLAL